LNGRALRADAEKPDGNIRRKDSLSSSWEEEGMAAASLAQVKMGMEGLALCIAGVLCERDPSLQAAFRERVQMLYRVLDDRGDHEAAAMVGAFGRALVDPAFKRPPN
jgi:hypothetical protein